MCMCCHDGFPPLWQDDLQQAVLFGASMGSLPLVTVVVSGRSHYVEAGKQADPVAHAPAMVCASAWCADWRVAHQNDSAVCVIAPPFLSRLQCIAYRGLSVCVVWCRSTPFPKQQCWQKPPMRTWLCCFLLCCSAVSLLIVPTCAAGVQKV